MNILCFVYLPLLIKPLSILHSNALLGRLVYVLIGLSGESANKTKLKVTASYRYDGKSQRDVSNDHRNNRSTLNNRQSLAQTPTTQNRHDASSPRSDCCVVTFMSICICSRASPTSRSWDMFVRSQVFSLHTTEKPRSALAALTGRVISMVSNL